MSTEPYVSFVTWGRNDGYTPDYVRRVSRATNCLAAQLERAGVDSEIFIIEWNPSPDRPLLLDILDLPKTLRHVTVRGVIVPPEYHMRLAGWRERGVHGGEAANVGIRRARGRFITPKASDTFYSPQVIEMIARHNLEPDTMYRIDRHDIAIDDDSIWALDDDTLLAKLETLPSEPHAWIQQLSSWGLRELHTNACGDFTLMGAPYWHRLHGHPKDETVLALDVDSLVMHAAAALGARECRWADVCRVYKPVHANLHGSRITQIWSPWQLTLDRFLAAMIGSRAAHWARMKLDYPRRKLRGVDAVLGPSIERNFVDPASRWARGTPPVPTQSESWGLADQPLEQRVLCRAGWDQVSVSAAR
jgi:hypothetical protein